MRSNASSSPVASTSTTLRLLTVAVDVATPGGSGRGMGSPFDEYLGTGGNVSDRLVGRGTAVSEDDRDEANKRMSADVDGAFGARLRADVAVKGRLLPPPYLREEEEEEEEEEEDE